MPKDIGLIGENILIDILKTNKIKYFDNRQDFKLVNREFIYYKNNKTIKYQALQKSHDFDFKVKDYNIEVKTSRISKDNTFCAGWGKNNAKIIDYVFIFIINNDLTINKILILNNKFINKHNAVHFKLNTAKYRFLSLEGLTKFIVML